MIDNINIIVMGETKEVSQKTTYLELSKLYENLFKNPIIIARQNGRYKELNDKIELTGEIEFFDHNEREANRIYLNGLVYLTIYAFKELYGGNIRVKHSIDKGLYIETDIFIDEEKVDKLKQKMEELVSMNLPIQKINVNRLDAIKYFNDINDKSKMGLMKYNTNTYVTLYKLGNMYNFFFSNMPISTGVLKSFDVKYLSSNGFVLLFPTVYMNDVIKEYEHHPKVFEVFGEYHNWAKLMKIDNSYSLNEFVSSGNVANLIRMDEMLQSNKLLQIAKDIYYKKDNIKIVLIAGPSSSGKTTTCNKLSMYLKSFGMVPHTVSMDDYFLNRDKTPKREDGTYDFEALEAVDLELFDTQMKELLEGKEVLMPIFNFLLVQQEFKKRLKLGKDDILIIEGIHGLNPNILTSIPKENKYRIYISPLTGLNLDNHNRMSTTDNRLLRRIVRDNRTRGHSVTDTIEQWPRVREGEEKYIFPYQDEADCVFNSALIYELGVLKTYVEPLLYSVDTSSEYYHEAKRLINMLKMFLPIPSEDIPSDSLLREFIGGSCFK